MSDPKSLSFSVPHLGGVKPGVLDPTQSARILRNPSSVLIFATYDPVVFATIGLDVALPSNARIVVEHTPGPGQANWFRLIPPARFGPGVQGEDGSWPKVVLLNGKSVIFEREQWEIYKLDPAYDCFLPSPGELPTITWIGTASRPPAPSAVPLGWKGLKGSGGQSSGYASAFSSSTSIAQSLASGSSAGFVSSADSVSSTSSTTSASSTSTVRPAAEQPLMNESEFRTFLDSSTFKDYMATIFSRSRTSTRGDASAAINHASVPSDAPGGASSVSSAAPTMKPSFSDTSATFLNPQNPTTFSVPPRTAYDPRSFAVPPEFAAPTPGSSGPGPVPFVPLSTSGFTPAAEFSAPHPAPLAPAPGPAPPVPTAESPAPAQVFFAPDPMPVAASSPCASAAAPAASTSSSVPSTNDREVPGASAAPTPVGQNSAPFAGPSVGDMSKTFARDPKGPATRTTGSRPRTSKTSKKAAKPYARPPRASTSGPVPEPFFMSAPSNRAHHPDANRFPEASSFSFQVPAPETREQSKPDPTSPSPVRPAAPEPLFRPGSSSSETLRSTSGTPSSASSSSTIRPRPRTPEIVDLTMEDDEEDEGENQKDVREEATGPVKRKRASKATQPRKRGRDVSPETEQADADLKHAQRQRDRRARTERVEDNQTKQRDARLWHEIFAGVRQQGTYSALPAPATQEDGMDVDHDATIEASKRKLADLVKDQPLWDEEGLKRAAAAQAEEACREKARRDAAEAAAEEERRSLMEAAAEEQRRAEQYAQRVEQARRETRRQQRLRWSPWNPSRAIPRYLELSEAFDRAKFTAEDPVDPLMIPWPVLRTPFSLQPPDIEWANVEAFFAKARGTMPLPQYKAFVAASNIRFHPDTWRKSCILSSPDKAMNAALEAASNVVSQTLTSIWKDSRTL